MHILTLAGLLLPLSSPSAESAPSIQEADASNAVSAPLPGASDDLFAPAMEPLAIAWPEKSEGASLLDVVQAYGQVTGQRLAIDKDTRGILGSTLAPLDRGTSVPAAEVQGFVEALLRFSGCVLTVDRSSVPRLIGVHSMMTSARNGLREHAINVDSSRIELLRRHPAMLFSTVVNLPNVDVRQLSNSLRTIITDSNTAQLLPAGNTNSMVVIGFGPKVADRVEQLRAIDASSKEAKVTISHELVRLQHAKALDVARLVEVALTTSGALRSPRALGQPAGPKPVLIQVSVLADERLNGLLVTCRSEDLEEARAVIAQLDVKE